MLKHNITTLKWWLLVTSTLLFTTLLIFYPGLSGDFEFDDGMNIYENSALKIDELSFESLYRSSTGSGHAGPLKRPISMATFALNIYFTGLDPFYMKLTNVILHILNGVSILILTILLGLKK